MSRYSSEFKLEVVKYCIDEHYGFKEATKYFNIPAKENIQRWVRRYESLTNNWF